jgi:hypothetical protein
MSHTRTDLARLLSTRQYARLATEWVNGIGLRREKCGTHSFWRTEASIIYRASGNLRAVQIVLGHAKIENTVRYLAVDVEDAWPCQRAPRCDLHRLLATVRSHTRRTSGRGSPSPAAQRLAPDEKPAFTYLAVSTFGFLDFAGAFDAVPSPLRVLPKPILWAIARRASE